MYDDVSRYTTTYDERAKHPVSTILRSLNTAFCKIDGMSCSPYSNGPLTVVTREKESLEVVVV